MANWLLKSEPSSYSWDQLVSEGRTNWDGVRNAQALNNLRAMQPGDRAFFYHSGEGREIVGVVEVVKSFYPDPADKSGKLGMGDCRSVPSTQPSGRWFAEWPAFPPDAGLNSSVRRGKTA